jgi:hypothetical protein
VERAIPNDPILKDCESFFAVSTLTTDPPTPTSSRAYAATTDGWQAIGRTPIKDLRLMRGVLRIKIEKAGFQSLVMASMNPRGAGESRWSAASN